MSARSLPLLKRGDLANVGFFPGYSLGARWLGWVLRTDSCHSLLALSQFCAWLFWVYVLLFLRLARVSRSVAVCSVAAILCHPAAFYLVVGYSESLFMCALHGISVLDGEGSKGLGGRSWLCDDGHTFGGPSGCPLPDFTGMGSGKRRAQETSLRRALDWWWVGAVSALGGLSFFAFCRLKFGYWDLYMQTLRIGWYVTSDWSAIYDPQIYRVHSRLLERTWDGDVYALSEISVPLTFAFFVVMAVLESWRALDSHRVSRVRQRVALYVSAWLMFHISVCGRYGLHMMGMIRYLLPVYALLVIAAAHWGADPLTLSLPELGERRHWPVWVKWVMVSALALALGGFLAAQGILAFNHTHGQWAA